MSDCRHDLEQLRIFLGLPQHTIIRQTKMSAMTVRKCLGRMPGNPRINSVLRVAEMLGAELCAVKLGKLKDRLKETSDAELGH